MGLNARWKLHEVVCSPDRVARARRKLAHAEAGEGQGLNAEPGFHEKDGESYDT